MSDGRDGRNGHDGHDGAPGVPGESAVALRISKTPMYVSIASVVAILGLMGISTGTWRVMSDTVIAHEVRIERIDKDIAGCQATDKEVAGKVEELTKQLTRLNTLLDQMERNDIRRAKAGQ